MLHLRRYPPGVESHPPATAQPKRPRLFSDATDSMPPWLPRLLSEIVLLVIAAFVVYNVLKALRGFLVLLLISVFLAIALEPAVAFLAKRGWRRGLATAFIFSIVLIVGSVFVALMIPLVIDQVSKLIDRAPGYLDQLSDFLANFGIDFSGEALLSAISSADRSVESLASRVAGNAFGVGSVLLSTILKGLTILLFTFYLTADAPKLRRTVLSVLQPERQAEVLRLVEIAIEKTGGYFYSRALLATVAAFVTWLALTVIDVPFAAPLAIWVGVLSQFVPVVGTYLGGTLPVLIALLEDPQKAIWVVIFIVAYQQFENYLIGPRITAHTMSLHPAVAFGAAIVGGTLLGAPGTIMALPVAATIQAAVSTYLHRHGLVESALFDEPKFEPRDHGSMLPRRQPRRSGESGDA